MFLFYVGQKVSEHQEEDVKAMNSKLSAITAVLTLFAGMAFAQEGAGAPMHHRRGGFMGGMELPLRQLNLTDDQKAQIKQIFQAEKPAMKPLMQQEHAARTQMVQLITSNRFRRMMFHASRGDDSSFWSGFGAAAPAPGGSDGPGWNFVRSVTRSMGNITGVWRCRWKRARR